MTAERKIVFSINLTLDGYADHESAIADNDLHDFFTDLLDKPDLLIFGRVTYEMMASYWPEAENDPEATESEKAFARKYNALSKIVFSNTLEKAEWNNSTIERGNLIERVRELKMQPGKDIFINSISLFQELARHDLIDEYWLLIHPTINPSGKRLFDTINNKINLTLVETRTFASGVVVLNYRRSSGS